jgi:diaminopimelate epimerase
VDLEFYKYHGTGNDFILLDETKVINQLSSDQIALLCHRHFGVGGDGLIQLRKKTTYDFEMVYYNSDGKTSSMCGNGGRCISQFAKDLGLVKDKAHFIAIDGDHQSIFKHDGVELQMINTKFPDKVDTDYTINTGSPHYIQFIKDIKSFDVFNQGKAIRNSRAFQEKGINVNFVEAIDDHTVYVRTYERGVENETLSCGTGVTAAAITYAFLQNTPLSEVDVKTLGGNLKVRFEKNNSGFQNVWLCGPAIKTFEGVFKL